MSETPRSDQSQNPFDDKNIFPDLGFKEIIRKEVERKREHEKFLKSLEGQPFEQETFSVEDINKVIEIRKNLDNFIKSGDNNPAECLQEVERYLNGLNVWAVRFSTGEIGKTKQTDSLYYMMPNGASLRLKRSELKRGIAAVVQPFMEIIFFEDKDLKPTEFLNIGNTTMEYCSEDFYRIQKQNEANKSFSSGIKRYYKNGGLFYMLPTTNLFHEHNGSEVNNVFYTSPELQPEK